MTFTELYLLSPFVLVAFCLLVYFTEGRWMPWINREELQRLRQRASQADNLNDSLSSIQQSLQNLHHQYHDLKGTLVSAIDDLTAAVSKVSDAVTAAVADIQSLSDQLKSGNTSNDPAIEDAANKLNAVADALNQAVNPPVPPTV